MPENQENDTRSRTSVKSTASATKLSDEEAEEFLIKDLNLISGPILSEKSSIPLKIITFVHSFGYNCKKLYNLCLIDEKTLVFVSGNLLHFFDIETRTVTTRRSSTGQGIGCVTKNPNPKYGYLTVAENGTIPPVIIYQYPSMEVISYLRRGTKRFYSHVAYSPDGELLATQGGEPDYMITIWDWQKPSVILRTKSFSNDILTVMFSPYVEGQLTTGGLTHIKFWKMCETFTGLKLKGDLGRFGKTEICDILGIYPMPDEKVLSGCEWGNVLVWDEGLIKYEVCRKSRKKMHSKMITQINVVNSENNEIMTASLDGYVRIWFWTTVENADPPDEDRFVEIEPIYEFQIATKTHTCEIVWMIKINPDDPEDYRWYIQDGNGGIWLTDLSPDYTPKPPTQLFRCHAGPIADMATSPFSTHVVTLGFDGRLHVYDYRTKSLLYFQQFPAEGRALKWLSPMIEPSGVVLVMGFGDGVIRVVYLDIVLHRDSKKQPLTIIQVLKSHSSAITKLSINRTQSILVSGSEDKTIFVHQLAQMEPLIRIEPIGLLELPAPCTAINWIPHSSTRVIIGCMNGTVIEADLPDRPRSYTTISYNLSHIETRTIKFKSVKSQIRREIQIKSIEERKEKKRLKKMESLTRLRKENPGLEIDENTFLEDSDSEEELDPLYIPKVPNQVLWIQCTPRDTIWLCMSGYDAGYIYEYEFGKEDPVRSTLIPEADDLEIHSYLYTDKYLILGLQNGNIRINALKAESTDFSDYFLLPMHDNINGIITRLSFSFDREYLFSVGYDGNLFSYKWNPEIEEDLFFEEPIEVESVNAVADIDDIRCLSLEQQKQKDDLDKRLKIAKERKGKVLDILKQYRDEFLEIKNENKRIIASQQVTETEMELDPRITEDLKETLVSQINLVRRKLEFDVEKAILANRKLKDHFIEPGAQIPFEIQGIVKHISAKTFRYKKLAGAFEKARFDLEERIKLEIARRRVIEYVKDQELKEGEIKARQLESFLQGLTGSTIEFRLEYKLKRLLDKYRARKDMEVRKKKELDYINSIKPDVSVNHPDDVREIEAAEKSIGDYKLKTDPMYVANEETSNTLRKFEEVLNVRETVARIKGHYNHQLRNLRRKKNDLVRFHKDSMIKLVKIHEELPVDERKFPEHSPTLNLEVEFPERNLYDPIQYNRLYSEKHEPISQAEAQNIRNEEIEIAYIGLKEYAAVHKTSKEIFENAHETFELKHFEPATGSELTMMGRERRNYRLSFLLFEQERILNRISKRIKQFDEEVCALNEAKLRNALDCKFLGLYLVTLNQELLVLRDFERLEYKLVENLDTQLIKRNEVQVKIIDHKNNVEQNRRNMDDLMEQEKRIHGRFLSACTGNKFFDFLRRIFKKKYKPPKKWVGEDEDSDSSSSDSSSEEEAENASVDSLEIGPIRLDENVCPPGCDRVLYDTTFALRAQRHEVEQKLKDEQKSVDLNKREIELKEKTKKSVDVELEKYRIELADFRREKQKMLNEIETVIVLKMSQMQYFTNEEEFNNVSEALLFNNDNITKLHSRVQQLEHETIEARRKHRVNVIHLSRMKTDCKFMEQQIVELKESVHEAMIKKFGRVVDLDELEEGVLSRMVYDMKANTQDIIKEYDVLLSEEKKRVASLQTEYNRAMQEGTEKLNILTVLHEEKNYLHEVLIQQHKMQHSTAEHIDYSRDVTRLKDISLQQQEQILMLQREIHTMNLKSKPFDTVINQDYMYHPVAEPKPGFGDHDFQESMFDAVATTLSQASSPRNYDLLTNAIKLVNKYLVKHFGKVLTEKEIKKREFNLGKVLTNAALNYNEHKRDECFQNAVEQFKNYSTKEIRSLLKDKEIADLFNDVLNSCRHIEMAVINGKEMVAALVDQALETQNEHRGDIGNFTHHLVLEVLKQMMLLLPLDDLKNEENLKTAIRELSEIKDINSKCINIQGMVEDLTAFVVENYIEEMTMELTRYLANAMKDGLAAHKK